MKNSDSFDKWIVFIVALGTIYRLVDIAKPFSGRYTWNEGHYAVTALNYFKYGAFSPMNELGLDVTTTPIFTWLVYLSFKTFGINEWSARIPSLFFAITSILLVYKIVERLYDRDVALFSAFISAISPGIVYISRNVQLESMFMALSLGALLSLIYYKDTRETKWIIISMISLSLAILTKYTAVLIYPALILTWFKYVDFINERRENVRLLLYLILPVLPSFFWIFYSFSVNPDLTIWYFYKPGIIWTFQSSITAMYLTVSKFVPEHFGYVFFYSFVLALPFLIRNLNKHAIVMTLILPWLAFIFMIPGYYLNSNQYYIYTMLYGLSILLGYSVVNLGKKLSDVNFLDRRYFKPIAFTLFFGVSIYHYNIFFNNYFTDFSSANESISFQSARHVYQDNIDQNLVVADFPSTMFYLGGDPDYIHLAYNTEGLIKAVEGGRYTYLVTYYAGNKTLVRVLEEYDYYQIAPRAWKKKGV